MAGIKIRTGRDGKVDVPHLLKQLDRQEKQYRKMLESGSYSGWVLETIHLQLGRIAELRAQHQQASADKPSDDSS